MFEWNTSPVLCDDQSKLREIKPNGGWKQEVEPYITNYLFGILLPLSYKRATTLVSPCGYDLLFPQGTSIRRNVEKRNLPHWPLSCVGCERRPVWLQPRYCSERLRSSGRQFQGRRH